MHEKVVAFSVEVFTLVELTQLTDQTDKEKVKAAIDTTLASDGTDFSVALEETQSLIEKGTTDSESRFVVFCFRWNWTNTLDRLRYNREGENALGWKTQEIFWRG